MCRSGVGCGLSWVGDDAFLMIPSPTASCTLTQEGDQYVVQFTRNATGSVVALRVEGNGAPTELLRQRPGTADRAAPPGLKSDDYAEEADGFLCRRTFPRHPADYPLPCRAPADDSSSPLAREFVISAWSAPTISPTEQHADKDQLQEYAAAHFTAVRTSHVAHFAQMFNIIPSPATANQVLTALLAALKRIEQAGLRAIFTPGQYTVTNTQEGDAYGGNASFGGLTYLENRTRAKSPWVLSAPELKYIFSELNRSNASVHLTFLHDDYFHVTAETMGSALWLHANVASAPGMTNGGLQDPVGLYSSRMFVLSAEQYYVNGPCSFNESLQCQHDAAWFERASSKPNAQIRTYFLSLIQSASLSDRFRLRAWPLFNIGGVWSDSLLRVQVYGALALGQHGIDYFPWAFNGLGVWDTGCTPQKGCVIGPNSTYPKGRPGVVYPFAKVANADAKRWGDLLVAASHVGSLSTMASTCANDSECNSTCSGGYPKGTSAVCVDGGCQCVLAPDASPVAGPAKPAPGLAIEEMDSDLLVGLFTGGVGAGYFMVVDTRASLSVGALAKRSVSLKLSSRCSATVVPPGVERSLESIRFSATSNQADGLYYQAVSLVLQAGEGALLQAAGSGCADVLRGAGRWSYDERSVSARLLFGRNIMVNDKVSSFCASLCFRT